ncbi:MAG: 2-oxo acid dehydrogenase subunit E2 [Planctomycetaceae bacterium]|nr:2-oxo acid dehydrogenase subunit E2 [Planctomycetaceae bacterium]
MPELGEGVYEAELVEWRVRPGDVVKPAQTLAEMMTDKAVMDLPAPFSGTIEGLQAEAGAVVKVGQVILTYSPSGAAAPASEPASAVAPQPAAKASQETPRPKKPAPSPATTAPVAEAPLPADTLPAPTSSLPRPPAAPSVRRVAAALGIDLLTVRGTGPGGRILLEDVTGLMKTSGESKAGAPKRSPMPAPRRQLPADLGTPGARIAFRGMRRKTAERMVHSARTIPHYAYIDECDVTELVRLRDALREPFAQRGVHLTFLPFFVRAAVEALQEIPLVNSSLDDDEDEILLHDRYDIGIATATPRGLVVPVVRRADRLTLGQIGREIERLSGEARTGTLRVDDLGRSTFTITSIGSIGGLISTPVINHPETAILGIGKIVKRPVYDAAGQIRPADMVYLSFSFDHRVIDGAVGAAFGNAVLKRLQNPAALLLADDSVD